MLAQSNWTSARELGPVRTRSPTTSGALRAAATKSPLSPRRTETSPLIMLMRATPRLALSGSGASASCCCCGGGCGGCAEAEHANSETTASTFGAKCRVRSIASLLNALDVCSFEAKCYIYDSMWLVTIRTMDSVAEKHHTAHYAASGQPMTINCGLSTPPASRSPCGAADPENADRSAAA